MRATRPPPRRLSPGCIERPRARLTPIPDRLFTRRRTMFYVIESSKPLDRVGEGPRGGRGAPQVRRPGRPRPQGEAWRRRGWRSPASAGSSRSATRTRPRRCSRPTSEISTALPCRISVYEEGGDHEAGHHQADGPDRAVRDPRAQGGRRGRGDDARARSWRRPPGRGSERVARHRTGRCLMARKTVPETDVTGRRPRWKTLASGSMWRAERHRRPTHHRVGAGAAVGVDIPCGGCGARGASG